MKPINKEQVDISDLARILWRRKLLILAFVIFCIGPVIYHNENSPPVFKAMSLVLFDTQQRSPLVDVFQIDAKKDFISNQIEEMKTESFAEATFHSLSKEDMDLFSFPSAISNYDDTVRFASGAIRRGLRLRSVAGSDIVEIGFESTNPKLAMTISNKVSEVLIDRNLIELRKSSANVWNMVNELVEVYEKQLESAEIALKRFKEQNGITISPDRESSEIFTRVTQAVILYNKVGSQRVAAEKRLAHIQNILQEQKQDLVPKITNTTNPSIQRLKEMLIDLEIQYTSLKAQNYSPSHAAMVRLMDQITKTKENIRQETLKISLGESIVDPLSEVEKLLEEIVNLDIEIETFKAQEAALGKLIDQYTQNLETVPEKELELAPLLRNKEANEQIYLMLLQKREEARIAESQKNVSFIRVINPARQPEVPIRPRKTINIAAAILFGLFIGSFFSLVPAFLDNKIRTQMDLEHVTGHGVLATIPRFETYQNGRISGSNGKMKKLLSSPELVSLNPKTPASEALMTLRTSLQFSGIDNPLKSVLVTSATPNAGKSVISANLAITMANLGLRTLLIDADMRNPRQHALFQKRLTPGLSNLMLSARSIILKNIQRFDKVSKRYLAQGHIIISSHLSSHQKNDLVNALTASIPKAVKPFILPTAIDNLYFLPAGTLSPNPADMLASETMLLVLRLLKANYDIVIFDSPPALAVTDAPILSSLADYVLLVVRSGDNTLEEVTRAKQLLTGGNSKSFGFVLNKVKERNGQYYGYYYPSRKQQRKEIDLDLYKEEQGTVHEDAISAWSP